MTSMFRFGGASPRTWIAGGLAASLEARVLGSSFDDARVGMRAERAGATGEADRDGVGAAVGSGVVGSSGGRGTASTAADTVPSGSTGAAVTPGSARLERST